MWHVTLQHYRNYYFDTLSSDLTNTQNPLIMRPAKTENALQG